MTITTTLNKIKSLSPDEKDWSKLLTHVGKTEPDDEELTFSTILESNGILNTIWCLKSIVPEHEKDVRKFAATIAQEVVIDHPEEKRLQGCLDVVLAYCEGKADITQLQELEASFPDPDRAETDYVINAVEATATPDYVGEMACYVAAYAEVAGMDRKRQAEMIPEFFS